LALWQGLKSQLILQELPEFQSKVRISDTSFHLTESIPFFRLINTTKFIFLNNRLAAYSCMKNSLIAEKIVLPNSLGLQPHQPHCLGHQARMPMNQSTV